MLKTNIMHTLRIKTNKEVKNIWLNTDALPEAMVDNLVNEWLNTYPDCDWDIIEGYATHR